MIETAVRLISERGVAALSISAVAREMGVDRTTIYYHFEGREDLLAAVKIWSSEQLAKAFKRDAPQQQRADYITRFVLDNPELMKLWIEDFISGKDIRQSYPLWDELVEGIRLRMAESSRQAVDAEVYCINLLTSSFIGPRVFRNSVAPGIDKETVVRRFGEEHHRVLKDMGMLDE